MNKNLIKKKYTEKIKALNHYNKKYYDENTSEITDAKFDILKKVVQKQGEEIKKLKKQKRIKKVKKS